MNQPMLKPTVSVLGLHGFAEDPPGTSVYATFHGEVMDVFERCGVPVTYFAAEGDGYSGEFARVAASSYKKLRSSDFRGVSVLSLAANPLGSDEPAFDSFATASLSYLDSTHDLTLSLVINEGAMSFGEEKYLAAVVRLGTLFSWFGGYGYPEAVDRHPDLYVVGLDNGKLSPAELKRLRAWYSAVPQRRMQCLRDVYRWNLLTEGTLDRQLEGGLSLRKIIQKSGGSVERLTGDALYLWRIDAARLNEERARLQKVGLIVE